MDVVKLTNFYYDFVVGEQPEKINERTKLLFEHLSESGCTPKQLFGTIIEEFPNKDELTIEDIPDSLWEGSLIERNKFYYHKELQILSPPPTWDKSFPFYIEMKIQYSIEDALKYFIKQFKINESWMNKDKELGSIRYLLKDYKKYGFIEPVDFFLHIIDYVCSKGVKINSIYDLRDYELEYTQLLELDILNSKALKKNRVVWRMDVCANGI